MKTIVTVTNANEGFTPYKQVVITTSLYDNDGDEIGIASIVFNDFGRFQFKVSLRYISNTYPKWIEMYNAFDLGFNRAKEIFQRSILPLIGKIGEEDFYHLVNDVYDKGWDGKKEGWNRVLDEVDRFLQSIDPEYRLFPELEADNEENP